MARENWHGFLLWKCHIWEWCWVRWLTIETQISSWYELVEECSLIIFIFEVSQIALIFLLLVSYHLPPWCRFSLTAAKNGRVRLLILPAIYCVTILDVLIVISYVISECYTSLCRGSLEKSTSKGRPESCLLQTCFGCKHYVLLLLVPHTLISLTLLMVAFVRATEWFMLWSMLCRS